MKIITRFCKSDRGAAAIEAAFILPFMYLLYVSMQDLTALISFNRKITSVTATISDTVAQYPSTITRANVSDIFNAVGMIMQPTPAANVHVDVYGYYLNGTTPAIRWQANNNSGPTCNLPDTTNFANLMTAGNDLVVSVTCMNYAPYVAQFMGVNVLGKTNFLLNQVVTSRPRASYTLNCVTVSGGSTSCTS